MSNPHELLANSSLPLMKSKYLELISNGYLENKALEEIGFPRYLYLKELLSDIDFAKAIEDCRKLRADFWVSKIAENIDTPFSKEDIPCERLKFDKLQFLARADNPDRYGNNSKKVDISVDLAQFKLLPPDKAIEALSRDPFAIEVEFSEKDIKEDLL